MPFKTPPPLQTHINKCSSRLDKVAPFLAMDVMAQAKVRTLNGESIVHMEVGEPSASTPLGIKQAAIDALNHGNVGYTQALGLPALRARIAQHYADQYRITIPMERVVVTTGSSAGFVLSFLTLFNAGDRVAIACPGYPAYRNILSALDLEPVLIPSGADEGWIMSAQAIMAAHNQKPLHGVLVMSPANPTGKMMSAHELSGLTSTCQNLGLPLISDEIYHGLTFESEATTALHANDQAIIINSFSKYYAMTGWRIGWMIVPDHFVRPIERLTQNLYISAPYLSQIAAIKAFDARDDLEAIRQDYAANRALLLEALPRLGLTRFAPADGAFYIYADISDFASDSISFCQALLDETGVAATPGLDFDPVNGHRYVRFSYAGSFTDCTNLIERLTKWPKIHAQRAYI